jgi:imidazolonepropionase-like amidohydrolase
MDPTGAPVDTMLRELVRHHVSVDPTLVAYHTKFWWSDSLYQRHPERAIVPELVANWEVLGMPTAGMTADEFRRARAAWRRQLALVRRMHDAGVLLTAGSDVASPWVIPGVAFHQELALLQSAGLSNRDVLAIGTTNGARALGIDADVGIVAPGMRADLVVLDRDPLRDIGATRSIRFVVKDGVLHEPSRLLRR